MYNGVTVRAEVNFLCPYLQLDENEYADPWNLPGMKVSFSCVACLEISLGNSGWHEKNVKIQGDSCGLTLPNPNMTTKLPHHLPVLREMRLTLILLTWRIW